MRGLFVSAVVVLFAVAGLFTSPAVRASGTSLGICNHTAQNLIVAYGYHSRSAGDTGDLLTGPVVSEGWWTVRPGACSRLANPFAARYLYWWGYAQAASGQAASRYFAGIGTTQFCVPNEHAPSDAFTFEGENASIAACESGHYARDGSANQWVSPRTVDVETAATVTVD